VLVQTYPVRTSHRKNLDVGAIASIAREHFDRVEASATAVEASYGAIERLEARPEGRALLVDVRTNPKVDEAVARESIARYNRFLEEVTGFNAKERARRLRKSAGE
jgi:hypothetical protein